MVLDREGFREWLTANHDTESECYLLVNKSKKDDGTLPYVDAVEEALCFGWIDSTHKKGDDGRRYQRFSPRRHGSRFTRLNLARCERMERLGLMTEYGRAVLPDKGYRVDRYILARIKKDPELVENILKFPQLYVEVRIDNIQYLRKEDPKLYKKRMKKFIDNTREGKMYGDWDDDGRLRHEPLFTFPLK